MIERLIHTDIQEIVDTFPSIMLLGPRQIGKTTLAKQIAARSGKVMHYFDLENENDLYALKQNPFDTLERLKNDLVVLDEVQTHPPLLSALRSIIDQHRVAGRFILLGSADPSLVKGISESLAGRVIYKEICQISLLEAQAYGIDLETHWFRGGFPESLLLKSDKMRKTWTESFLSSYVYRDINHLFGINLTPQVTLKLWSMLAYINSEMENLESLGRSLGITGTSVKKYLDYMQGAYLLRKLAPWHENNGKRLVKSHKLYVRTPAILHHLLQIGSYDQLLVHPALGASWEAYVVEQLYIHLPDSLQMYFYRTHHGAEVDVVLVKGVKPIATIEIKFGNAPNISKGTYECIADLQSPKNYVVTPNSKTVITKEGILVISLLQFLKEELPTLA